MQSASKKAGESKSKEVEFFIFKAEAAAVVVALLHMLKKCCCACVVA
jgi:hypothetical protein